MNGLYEANRTTQKVRAGVTRQACKDFLEGRFLLSVIRLEHCPRTGFHQRGDKPRLMTLVAVVSALLRCATRATLTLMKNRTITQRELRNQSGAILREVEAGRTVIVTRNGTPVGELRPLRRRRFVPRSSIADAAAQAAQIDAKRFRADLDAVVDPNADV